MKRRQFLQHTVAASAVASIPGAIFHSDPSLAATTAAREFYELRTYEIGDADMQNVIDNYLQTALLPALARQGLSRIGVFTQLLQDGEAKNYSIFVLIPYPSLDVFAQQHQRLAADQEYLKAAESYYSQPMKAPAYSRINSRFMLAFQGMPVMELPSPSKSREPRLFELRIYESHNEDAARRKVEMFNEGEIQLMREVGLAPVMYGETLIGDNVPNLTYMLSAPDMASHKAHWKAFIEHPEWDRMKKIERYADTVSKIENWYLQPTDYSQM
jgi:hypothetical protein